MTYGELFNLFKNNNPSLKPYISDYRPGGYMSLTVWFNNGMSLTIMYNEITKIFELK